MKTSDSIANIAPAIIKAHGEMKDVKRNSVASFETSKGGRFENAYADLEAVTKTIRPVLTKNGLALIQSPCTKEGMVGVSSRLVHESGEWMEDEFYIGSLPPDPKQVGAAITYMRRYAAMAICGIAPEDDETNLEFSNKKRKGGKTPAAMASNTTDYQRQQTERDVTSVIRALPPKTKKLFTDAKITSVWDMHKLYKQVAGDVDALDQMLEEKISGQ